MPAPLQTAPQVALTAQQGPQYNVILQHQCAHFTSPVPIRTEVKVPLDLDYDKPRVSLIIRVFVTSLSYPIDAPVSRGCSDKEINRCWGNPSRPARQGKASRTTRPSVSCR